MADTKHGPCTDVGQDGDGEPADIGLKLAGLPSELLVRLAETDGNPLALLISKAHLSKAFREAASAALALLKHANLRKWSRTVDDTAVAAVVSKCTQLSSLNLSDCQYITNAAVLALAVVHTYRNYGYSYTYRPVNSVASGCPLTSLNLYGCGKITNAAVFAVVSSCKQLTTLNLSCCKITDAAVVALASACKQLTTLNLTCCNITDAAVVAVASRNASSSQRKTAGCRQLATLDLTTT